MEQGSFGAATRVLQRIPHSPIYNLILSNVPGPQAQLYFLGYEVDTMYPLGPLLGSAGLNITVMSFNGGLGVGIISCPDLLPDLWELADAFTEALKESLECTERAALQRMMLLHTSAAMTLGTYSDLFDDDLDAWRSHYTVAIHARVWAKCR